MGWALKDDPIPDADHVARYCGGATLDDGQVSGASFKLRPMKDGNKEEYLSVNWLELLGKESRREEIGEVQRVLTTKMTPGSTAKLAVLRVGDVKDYVSQSASDRRILRILHRPDEPPGKPDPSHSGIFGTDADEDLIAELIAERVLETYAAK